MTPYKETPEEKRKRVTRQTLLELDEIIGDCYNGKDSIQSVRDRIVDKVLQGKLEEEELREYIMATANCEENFADYITVLALQLSKEGLVQ